MTRIWAAVAMFAVGGLLWVIAAWPSIDDAPVPPAEPQDVPVPTAAIPQPTAAVVPTPAAEPELAPPVADPSLAAEPAPEPLKPNELIAGDQGPVAEYRAQFERDTRGSDAAPLENRVREAFQASKEAPDLVKSVLCKKTVCKIEMRWSNERMRPYIAGLTRVWYGEKFARTPALSPVGEKGKDGLQIVEVYLRIKQPADPEPAHAH